MRQRDQVAVRLATVSLGQGLFERAQYQRQGRTKLVAHVGEERRLGVVELGQDFGAAALFFVGLSVGDGGGDLARRQAEEAAVAFIKDAEGIETDNENAGAGGFARRRDG